MTNNFFIIYIIVFLEGTKWTAESFVPFDIKTKDNNDADSEFSTKERTTEELLMIILVKFLKMRLPILKKTTMLIIYP